MAEGGATLKLSPGRTNYVGILMTNQIPHNSEADENDVLGDTKLVSTRATYPYSVHICRVVRIRTYVE